MRCRRRRTPPLLRAEGEEHGAVLGEGEAQRAPRLARAAPPRGAPASQQRRVVEASESWRGRIGRRSHGNPGKNGPRHADVKRAEELDVLTVSPASQRHVVLRALAHRRDLLEEVVHVLRPLRRNPPPRCSPPGAASRVVEEVVVVGAVHLRQVLLGDAAPPRAAPRGGCAASAPRSAPAGRPRGRAAAGPPRAARRACRR